MSGDGGPAFPINPDTNMSFKGEIYPELAGLSKRELIAAMAMQGLIGSPVQQAWNKEKFAIEACRYADALLAELARERDDG